MQKSKWPKLSDAQITVLEVGAIHRLSRSSMGWSVHDERKVARIYSPATVKSLWKRGLIDANFDDARGFGPCHELRDVQNLDGTRHAHSPEVHMLSVWTNERGKDVLEQLGFLPELANGPNIKNSFNAEPAAVISLLARRRQILEST